jgi:hypothetical protein
MHGRIVARQLAVSLPEGRHTSAPHRRTTLGCLAFPGVTCSAPPLHAAATRSHAHKLPCAHACLRYTPLPLSKRYRLFWTASVPRRSTKSPARSSPSSPEASLNTSSGSSSSTCSATTRHALAARSRASCALYARRCGRSRAGGPRVPGPTALAAAVALPFHRSSSCEAVVRHAAASPYGHGGPASRTSSERSA